MWSPHWESSLFRAKTSLGLSSRKHCTVAICLIFMLSTDFTTPWNPTAPSPKAHSNAINCSLRCQCLLQAIQIADQCLPFAWFIHGNLLAWWINFLGLWTVKRQGAGMEYEGTGKLAAVLNCRKQSVLMPPCLCRPQQMSQHVFIPIANSEIWSNFMALAINARCRQVRAFLWHYWPIGIQPFKFNGALLQAVTAHRIESL